MHHFKFHTLARAFLAGLFLAAVPAYCGMVTLTFAGTITSSNSAFFPVNTAFSGTMSYSVPADSAAASSGSGYTAETYTYSHPAETQFNLILNGMSLSGGGAGDTIVIDNYSTGRDEFIYNSAIVSVPAPFSSIINILSANLDLHAANAGILSSVDLPTSYSLVNWGTATAKVKASYPGVPGTSTYTLGLTFSQLGSSYVVPEPSSMALAGAGFALVAFRRRRAAKR
jgi:hypothetical protein